MNWLRNFIVSFALVVLALPVLGKELEANAQPRGNDEDLPGFLAESGTSTEATLRAYFYYKDRGDFKSLANIVTESSGAKLPKVNGEGMSKRAQAMREIVLDHSDEGANSATLYYRSWFSLAAKNNGGRPYVAKLIKEDGKWRFDVEASVRLTMAISKGRTQFGFYDGTKEWWK